MIYRCVKANDSNDVLTIGRDENQGGQDYNGIGTWQNFTFTEYPVCTQEMRDKFEAHPQPLLKVENGAVCPKDVGELI